MMARSQDPKEDVRFSLGGFAPAPSVQLLEHSLIVFPGQRLRLSFPNAVEMRLVFEYLTGDRRCDIETKFLDGKDISFLDPEQLARQGIGFGSGRRRVFPSLTLNEHVRLRLWATGDPRSVKAAVEAIRGQFSALTEVKGTAICGNLSGGQQQLLMLALATVGAVKLVVIEDAWMGLSFNSVKEVEETFRSLEKEGAALILLAQGGGEDVEKGG